MPVAVLNAFRSAASVFALSLALGFASLCALPAGAEDASAPQLPVKILHLTYISTENESNEILVVLRNLLPPPVRLVLDPSTKSIVITATPEQIATAEKLIAGLDQPKKSYRLTYTFAEFDEGKRVGVQHFATVAFPGQRTNLKETNRIPMPSGSTSGMNVQTQFTYIDIGITLDFTLEPFGNGLRLNSRIEQSGTANAVSIGPLQEPVIRQANLEGTSLLTPGKPSNVGSLDIIGTTRHVDIEVIAEPIS